MLETPQDHTSFNFLVLSEQEVKQRKQIRIRPTMEEMNVESDPNFQFLWEAYKLSLTEGLKKGLSVSEDHQSTQLLKHVHHKYFEIQAQRRRKSIPMVVPEENLMIRVSAFASYPIPEEQGKPYISARQNLVNREILEDKEEKVRKVEREDFSMFSLSSDDNSCRLGEKNEDHALNSFSSEDHPKADVLLEDETPNDIEEHSRSDSPSIKDVKDPVPESFFF